MLVAGKGRISHCSQQTITQIGKWAQIEKWADGGYWLFGDMRHSPVLHTYKNKHWGSINLEAKINTRGVMQFIHWRDSKATSELLSKKLARQSGTERVEDM